MTTIITRLYPDVATAQAVVTVLIGYGHDQGTIDVIARDGASDLTQRMHGARVNPAAAAAYASHMESGEKALLVVRAGFNPIGAARNALKVTAKYPSLDVDLEDENQYVREDGDGIRNLSILPNHPLFLSNRFRPTSHAHILGENPILPPRDKRSAIAGGAYMSTKFWPMKLIWTNPNKGDSVIHGGKLFLTTMVRSR